MFFDDERTSKTHADYPRVHGDTKNVEVGDTRKLTGFRFNGEYLPDTFSEPRGSVLRASAENLMVGCPTGTQGANKGLICRKNCSSISRSFYPLLVREGTLDATSELRRSRK